MAKGQKDAAAAASADVTTETSAAPFAVPGSATVSAGGSAEASAVRESAPPAPETPAPVLPAVGGSRSFEEMEALARKQAAAK